MRNKVTHLIFVELAPFYCKEKARVEWHGAMDEGWTLRFSMDERLDYS